MRNNKITILRWGSLMVVSLTIVSLLIISAIQLEEPEPVASLNNEPDLVSEICKQNPIQCNEAFIHRFDPKPTPEGEYYKEHVRECNTVTLKYRTDNMQPNGSIIETTLPCERSNELEPSPTPRLIIP